MSKTDLKRISISGWDDTYPSVPANFRNECRHMRDLKDKERFYLAAPSHYASKGDILLNRLKFDPSFAALRLWSFLFSEKDRLFEAKKQGWKIFAAMKDLGIVPVITYSLPKTLTFYADELWWAPCFAEDSRLLDIAAKLGATEELCFVRAALGAMKTFDYFPEPDLCIAAVGSCCDDFSAVMQLIEWQGLKVHWWEMPSRDLPKTGSDHNITPYGKTRYKKEILSFIAEELKGVANAASDVAGEKISSAMLLENMRRFNRIRRLLSSLREKVYSAERAPLPGLEMFLAEFLPMHGCSDPEEAENVLVCLHSEVDMRLAKGLSTFSGKPVRIFWATPPTDASLITILEDCGGTVCGTEYLISHSFFNIRTTGDPFLALAENHLDDPMAGACGVRVRRILKEAKKFRAEGVIISGIFGASHCPFEDRRITDELRKADLPVLSFDVPFSPGRPSEQVKNRIESFVEIIKKRR